MLALNEWAQCITKGPITEWAQYQSRAHRNTNHLKDCSLDYQINIVMGPLVMHWVHSVMGPMQCLGPIRCLGPLLNGPNVLLKGPSLNGPSINQGLITIQIICKIVHLITKYSDGPFSNALGPFSNGPNSMCWH